MATDGEACPRGQCVLELHFLYQGHGFGSEIGMIAPHRRRFSAFHPRRASSMSSSRVHGKVLGLLVAVAISCVLLFGIAPALRLLRRNPLVFVKQNGRSGASGTRLRDVSVVAQAGFARLQSI